VDDSGDPDAPPSTALQRQQPGRLKLNWADRALLATLLGVIPKARRQGQRLLVTPDTIALAPGHRPPPLGVPGACAAGPAGQRPARASRHWSAGLWPVIEVDPAEFPGVALPLIPVRRVVAFRGIAWCEQKVPAGVPAGVVCPAVSGASLGCEHVPDKLGQVGDDAVDA
jgi:hypothetical protein